MCHVKRIACKDQQRVLLLQCKNDVGRTCDIVTPCMYAQRGKQCFKRISCGVQRLHSQHNQWTYSFWDLTYLTEVKVVLFAVVYCQLQVLPIICSLIGSTPFDFIRESPTALYSTAQRWCTAVTAGSLSIPWMHSSLECGETYGTGFRHLVVDQSGLCNIVFTPASECVWAQSARFKLSG